MRILFMANAPWAKTGYGIQGRHLTRGWRSLGHDVGYFSFYGVQGGSLTWDGITILPTGIDPWGNDIIQAHCNSFKADVLITLMDIWVQDHYGTLKNTVWAPWMPIDSQPVAPAVADHMWGAKRVITYAKFGLEEARKVGVDADYIPHGVDTSVFHPGDQAAARKRIGLPESGHITAIVAANKGTRKALAENIAAWGVFHREHPDSVLYLHTLMGAQHHGIDIPPLVRHLGLDKCVFYVDQYRYVTGALESDYMASVYQASDVLLAASTSEGFGVPILEAQACGVPAITTNFTSMPELTWFGATVEPAQLFWCPQNTWQAVPSMLGITKALRVLYDMAPAEREQRRWHAINTVAREYAWDILIERYWEPFLEDLAAELKGDRPPKLAWPDRQAWQRHCYNIEEPEEAHEPVPDSGGAVVNAI
jgi:glycosyltransferase involved in cell wall biosynthesis